MNDHNSTTLDAIEEIKSFEVQSAHPEIAWQLMRGMRNRLVHTYFSVSPKILWDMIQQDLPALSGDLKKLLS